MGFQTRMYLLIAVMIGILYGAITIIGTAMGVGSALSYILLALVFIGFQYLISPSLVGWTMKVKWVSEAQEPELHRMVDELAREANLPKPRVGISQLNIPNAFAYGRTQRDGRICVTVGMMKLVDKEELRAVLGHEMSHIRHRDMAVITLLSAIPLILYWIAWGTMYGGGRRQGNGGYAALIGLGAFVMYFITNLLVLYGSRTREYYADKGSVQLGNRPHFLASALYKLAYSSMRTRGSPELKRIDGARAFFISDPSHAWNELRELSQLDPGKRGVIDQNGLLSVRQMNVRLKFGDRMAELLTTHPHTLNRIKQLSDYVA
jgi:heat shock protein HtpX